MSIKPFMFIDTPLYATSRISKALRKGVTRRVFGAKCKSTNSVGALRHNPANKLKDCAHLMCVVLQLTENIVHTHTVRSTAKTKNQAREEGGRVEVKN